MSTLDGAIVGQHTKSVPWAHFGSRNRNPLGTVKNVLIGGVNSGWLHCVSRACGTQSGMT